jgi:hypothetical protein
MHKARHKFEGYYTIDTLLLFKEGTLTFYSIVKERVYFMKKIMAVPSDFGNTKTSFFISISEWQIVDRIPH